MRPPHVSVAVLVLSFAYAIVRYHLVKGLPWADLPLFVTNKAIALASVVLLAAAFLSRGAGVWSRSLGRSGLLLAAVHVVISLTILDPEYFPGLFHGDRFDLDGGASVLFGVLAWAALSSLTVFRLYERGIPATPLLVQAGLVFVGAHLVALGLAGWGAPATWPGGLVPISLVAFLVVAAALVVRGWAGVIGRVRARRRVH